MRMRIVAGLGILCATPVFLASLEALGRGAGAPDVLYSECTSVADWGPENGRRAYALGTHTCNVGTANLLWGVSNNGTPVVGFNAYRLEDGRLMQIGMSWAKHGTGAAAGSGCNLYCNGQGGTVLGAGCRDVYSASFNGIQGILGPRSDVNAWTGALIPVPPGGSGEIERRLQIREADLDAASHPDALYFVEGVYVALDDAGIFGNAYNNASHKRVNVAGDYSMSTTGPMQKGIPAIFAWRDHGNGPNMPDPLVQIQAVDIGSEGRMYVGSRVRNLGGGQWRYDYAIFNLNSDRSLGGFRVNFPDAVTPSDIGFHDVEYHSGEIYDNFDWTVAPDASGVTWFSPQTHAENPNSNALRWGTMYNFWFTANAPAVDGTGRLTPFKPGIPDYVGITVAAPGHLLPCPQDLNENGVVDFADVLIVIGAWGPCGGCAEDLDETGDVGFSDVLYVLAGWGDCP